MGSSTKYGRLVKMENLINALMKKQSTVISVRLSKEQMVQLEKGLEIKIKIRNMPFIMKIDKDEEKKTYDYLKQKYEEEENGRQII
jgi:hypothetical protein